jgi:DNA modification methylase
MAGEAGHPAGTPMDLADWWIRYISPSGGVVCDPFAGTSTVGRAAIKLRRSYIGIEQFPKYYAISRRLLSGDDPEPVPASDGVPVPVQKRLFD